MKINNRIVSVLALFALALTAPHTRAQSIYTPYTFTTLAGNAGYGSADGTGSAARFNGPDGVAVDTNGNLYVADSGNHNHPQSDAGGHKLGGDDPGRTAWPFRH